MRTKSRAATAPLYKDVPRVIPRYVLLFLFNPLYSEPLEVLLSSAMTYLWSPRCLSGILNKLRTGEDPHTGAIRSLTAATGLTVEDESGLCLFAKCNWTGTGMGALVDVHCYRGFFDLRTNAKYEEEQKIRRYGFLRALGHADLAQNTRRLMGLAMYFDAGKHDNVPSYFF